MYSVRTFLDPLHQLVWVCMQPLCLFMEQRLLQAEPLPCALPLLRWPQGRAGTPCQRALGSASPGMQLCAIPSKAGHRILVIWWLQMTLEQASSIPAGCYSLLGRNRKRKFIGSVYTLYVLINNLQVPKSSARSFQISQYKLEYLDRFKTTADCNISEAVLLFSYTEKRLYN